MYSFSSSAASRVVASSSVYARQSTTWLAHLSRPRCCSFRAAYNGQSTCRSLSTTTATFGTSFRDTGAHRPRRSSNDGPHNNTFRTTGNEELKTWEELGLRSTLIEGLKKEYPEVVAPTAAQGLFIPAILEGRDLMVKDETGSGKSFGIALALLGKPRVQYAVRNKPGEFRDSVTALIIVPQANLAHQYYQWISKIADASNASGVGLETDRIVQQLVRSTPEHLQLGMTKLHSTKPHILICTPQAALEVYQKEPGLIPFGNLSTVVVDEVDYLIETVPRKDPERSWSGSLDKLKKKIERHPGPTRELLDIIFAERKQANEKTMEWAWDEKGNAPYKKGPAAGGQKMPGPQLIMASATLRAHLSYYIHQASGWLDRSSVLRLRNPGPRPLKGIEGANAAEVKEAARSGRVKHCVIEVTDTETRNVEGAISVEELDSDVVSGMTEEGGKQLEAQAIFTNVTDERQPMDHEGELQDGFIERYQNTPSPFNPNGLEAIATAVALDVPRLGLLILPSGAPVFRAVYELREMGLDARVFDPQKGVVGNEGDEDPVLLVTTVPMARGLDVPAASHVFSLGIPNGPAVSGRTVDAYIHIAGRVGRFGRRGTVVTVVEAGLGERMKRILGEVGVAPVRFRQFE